jgi:CheY-like chemotaxis protein
MEPGVAKCVIADTRSSPLVKVVTPLHTAKVLIVDDDSAMRRSLGDTVEADGHQVVGQASDGSEALALLSDGCVADVVLLDLHMPIMNGWEFLRALRDSGRPTPAVIVVSSLDVDDDSLPVFAEIHKGAIDAEHLWSTIRAAVRARRRRSSRRAAAR